MLRHYYLNTRWARNRTYLALQVTCSSANYGGWICFFSWCVSLYTIFTNLQYHAFGYFIMFEKYLMLLFYCISLSSVFNIWQMYVFDNNGVVLFELYKVSSRQFSILAHRVNQLLYRNDKPPYTCWLPYSSCSCGMTVLANLPKPVFNP